MGPIRPATRMRHAAAAAALLLCLAGAAVLFTRAAPARADETRLRALVCAETLEVFRDVRIREGDPPPWRNPRTGRRTLMVPERCYWTRDGSARTTPTYVLLNEARDLPGPTICPDCGREVVFHNPLPPSELLLEASRRGKNPRRKGGPGG
jgi:hypothetical protein